MLKIVKRFEAYCSSNQAGLCVIAMPTGVGKTYQIVDQIAHFLLNGQKQKTIYVTPLNKNVAEAYFDILGRLFELKGLSVDKARCSSFEPQNKEEEEIFSLFAKKTLLLKSYLDTFKSSFSNETISSMTKSGFFSEKTEHLSACVSQVKRLEGQTSIDSGLPLWKEEFEKTEHSFRKDLKNWIDANCTKKRIDKDVFLANHPWIGALYPSTRVDSVDVVVMGIDKFLSFDDPIFAKTKLFYLRDYVKGALVVLDEFDAIKEWILRRQIEEASKSIVDLSKSHLQILRGLKGHYPFPSFDDGSDKNGPKYLIPKLRERFTKESKRYCLDYTIKADTDDSQNSVFLFDNGNIQVIANERKYVSFELDKEKSNQLRLRFSDEMSDTTRDFIPAIIALRNCRSYFVSCGVKMSRYYFDHRNAEEKTFEGNYAVNSIMDYFHDEHLTQDVMDDYALIRPKVKRNSEKHDFFYDGFRYYYFEDSNDKELTTSLNMIELRTTPEKLLLTLLQRSKVLGLSATADIKTSTGNFAMDFVRSEAGKLYYGLTQEDRKEISDLCQNRLGEGVEPEIVPITSPKNDVELMVAEVFDDEDHRNDLNRSVAYSGTDDFQKERFTRYLMAVKHFVRSDGSVMLLMSNENPSEEKPLYTVGNMEKWCKLLNEEAGRENVLFKVFTLGGKKYETELHNYFEWMKDSGHRALLLTSYQTAGTGQNMQYEEVLEDLRSKRDIDTIYLEMPTNLALNLNDAFAHDLLREVKEQNLLKYLYQLQAINYTKEISDEEAKIFADNVFKLRGGSGNSYKGSLKKTPSIQNHAIKVLIQAVGRICRVNDETKRPKKRIYFDSNIATLDFAAVRNMPLNPEFKKLIDYISAHDKENDDPRLIAAMNHCDFLNSWIHGVLGRFDDKTRAQWKDIRDYALSHPRINADALDARYNSLYMECEGESYFVNGAECDIEIAWHENAACPIEISEKTSRLPLLMQVKEIREYFEAHGYATSFGSGNLILNPVAFLNIYLGALGEASVKAILENDGFLLAEIEENNFFEVFDFKYAEKDGVYLDCKHWKRGSKANELHSAADFQKKLEAVNGKAVYIVNILSEQSRPHSKGNVHFFPSLLKQDGDKVTRNEKAIFQLESLLKKER